jgi:hypothetical protein
MAQARQRGRARQREDTDHGENGGKSTHVGSPGGEAAGGGSGAQEPPVDAAAARLGWDDVPDFLDELREMAVRLLGRWPGMHSLQPTLLVDTALRRQRRVDQAWESVTWENRAQLFGQAFRAMEHKLCEYRRHQRTRAYWSQRRMSVRDLELYQNWRRWTADPDLALALEAGLARLRESAPQLAALVHFRFFAGLTVAETAAMLERSTASLGRDWKKVRLLMEAELRLRRAAGNGAAEGECRSSD